MIQPRSCVDLYRSTRSLSTRGEFAGQPRVPGTHVVFVGIAINCARTRRDEMKDAPTISDRRRLKRTEPAGERATGRTPEPGR
ncbi:hypothetical protein NP493_545g01092 [Ridgeia piscesae]|uniref:Uncharacterized protein n=1 Tax=Ridgeia piscesae TaxID=27915 RepID=A0AAD9KWY7_RIDPI|nr:hypothetical protein NP493_545g01092 [Ridgeia piscesae]